MNDETPPRRHLLVRASAGSGKTYCLVRRLIGLLADEEAPESILAATFSRKAAGEFRRKMLEAVADAVLNPASAKVLAGEIGHSQWSEEDFLSLLRSLVRNPDALRLSTIDAFFLEWIGLFRLELGLGTEVRLASETGDDFEQRDLLRAIFTAATDEIRQAIFHLVEEDRASESVRSFQEVLERWIANSLSLYRSAPEANVWGALPPDLKLPPATAEEWNTRLSTFEAALRFQSSPEECRDSIEETIDALRQWDLSPTLPEAARKWITAGAKDPEKLTEGKKSFRFNGKMLKLDAATGQALIALSEVYHAHHVHLAVRNTSGAYGFLRMFEEQYEMRRLRSGSIRFADLPYLLSALERIDGALMAYRLDASLRHWLLDEFQDTSRSQWQVMHPLVDELFFDSENYRSFFCVGDPKQAIYGWRQGDSRLFGEIHERYRNFEPRPLEADTLAKTYRCTPAIVSFVNQMFGSQESFPEELDKIVVERWIDGWTQHQSAKDHPAGRVRVTRAEDSEGRDRAVLDFLTEEKPWEDGRTVAVLCRKNKEANRFEAMLRSAGIPTVRDGALSLSHDFTSGRIVHAIFQVLAHPGDSAALSVLTESSLTSALKEFCGGGISASTLREQWEHRSLTDFLGRLESVLEQSGFMDDSERRALRNLFALMHGIESSPESSLREIVRALIHARVEDTGSSGSVQVLTIHRSKGLEFDVVLLPDIDESTGAGNFKEFWTHEESGRTTRILESVNKDVQSAFPPLAQWAETAARERLYEDLCVNYVAFTRAALSLHIFLGDKKRKSKHGIHYWIERAFGSEVETGLLVEMGEALPPVARKTVEPPAAEPTPPMLAEAAPRIARRLVSPSEKNSESSPSPFLPGRHRSLDLGRRVHEALARYEWPGTEFRPEEIHPAVAEILTPALANENIRNLLSPTDTPSEVWKERAFDACIDSVWNSGVFDRVHLPEGWAEGKGSPLIIDYKTDRIDPTEIPPAYLQQMQVYRSALAMILGIEETQIEAKLIFLRSSKVFSVF